jgi:hypothetical protein
MRTKDYILLEQAYESVLREDAQDAGADETLKKNLAYLIAMAGKAGKLTEGLAERNAPMVVDRLMELIQDHCKKSYEKGLADGQEDGIGLARSLDGREEYEG